MMSAAVIFFILAIFALTNAAASVFQYGTVEQGLLEIHPL